jgi:hypothetical protein
MSAPVSPDAKRIWAAAKGPVLVGLVILVSSLILVLVSSPSENGSLDPRSVSPTGSRAIARLLEGQGVKVEFTETAPSSVDGATLLVTRPDIVDPQRLQPLIAQAQEVVLVAPVRELPPGFAITEQSDVGDQQPGCVFAARFGQATMGGNQYTAPDGETCYGSSLVRKDNVTLLGTATAMTNEVLDDAGNAALMMSVLGQHERLVWWVPGSADPGREQSVFDLLPEGWKYGGAQLIVAVVLFALWRARRLGPVVTERLPVVVRSAETVEGRARLYRRSQARGHAGATLRRASIDRIAPAIGLASDAPQAAFAEEIAGRTTRNANEVLSLLYEPEPADDRALVRLADQLDVLENEVCGG